MWKRWILVSVCASTVCFGNSTLAQEVTRTADAPSQVNVIEGQEVWSHQTGRHGIIRHESKQAEQLYRAVTLRLVVSPEGEVKSVTPVEGPREDFAAAMAEARRWKYLPFEKDDAPATVVITDYVRILPPEKLPKIHRDFPHTGSGNGVVMTLERTGCFGTCPGYSVEIHGDGTVKYTGKSYVVVTGEHRDHISAEQVSELIDAFRAANYFSLEDSYSYPVTDNPTYLTSFRVDQVEKHVHDYVGDEAGMPEAVSELEAMIDRVADTKKWIRGTAETVPSLKREGYDFKSADAASLLARASEGGSSEMIAALLAEGVGLTGKSEAGQSALVAAAQAGDKKTVEMLMKAGAGKNDPEIETRALAAAARTGDLELVKKLLAYGGDPGKEIRDEQESGTVLMSAALSGVPEIVEAVLAERPDVNTRDTRGRTALWYLNDGSRYRDEEHHADRARVVHLLAKAGMNLNSQDKDGNTALHEAYYEDIANALIEDGANVNIRNADGETPLLSNFSAEVAKLLVAAGADVHARDHAGRNALDQALRLEKDGDRVKYLRSLKLQETPESQIHPEAQPQQQQSSDDDQEN
jgi:ankyrin repeat protein